ncbi:MAG: choice-of-anchor J domain-containing protein, partial [Flavipsychrobacter sp.]
MKQKSMTARISMLVLLVLSFTRVNAQNYLTQGFESSTFPPSGWTLTTSSGSMSDDGGPTGWAWQTSYGGSFPSIAAHGGSGMAWYNSWDIYSGGESYLATPAMNFSTYTGGSNQVSFWYYNISGYSDYLNVIVNTSASTSGSGATTLATISLSSASTGWHQYTYTIPSSYSSSSTVYIIFDANSQYQWDENIDDISVDHIPPCSGIPGVALIPAAAKMSVCSGGTATLYGNGTSTSSGQAYQWQTATSATGPWTDIAGATNNTLTTSPITSIKYFRLKDSCTASGGVGYSLPDTVGPGSPAYASLPYVQDFENWQNYCTSYDIPGGNWANSPSSGDGSWRRDDQGCSYGGWTSSGCTAYYVNYWSGAGYRSPSHCARFHSSPGYGYLSASGSPWSGSLDLYVDCSGAGNKLLQFFFKNQPYPYAGSYFSLYNNDSLDVFLSTNGGASFTQIWGADTANDWKQIRLDIASTSATTIIRFVGKRVGGDPVGFGYSESYSDIGLDSVYVGPACTTVPSTAVVSPSGTLTGCPGASYTLNIGSLPLVGGLTYQWKQATAPFSSFTNAVGGIGSTSYSYTTPTLFDSIQYEAVITCASTSSSATTAATTIAFSNKPSYAAINLPSPAGPGYHYSFENWNSRCSSND